jgi:hypothetical protein
MFSLPQLSPSSPFQQFYGCSLQWCELDEDVCMDEDDELDQEMQQGYLCVSTDPRRVGGPGGEPTIINIEELRALMITQQSLD